MIRRWPSCFQPRGRVAWSERADVLRLRALGALRDVVLHSLVLLEGAETLSHDGGEMRENVLAAVILGDEAETLVRVEPFDGTGSHDFSLPTCESRTLRTSRRRVDRPGKPSTDENSLMGSRSPIRRGDVSGNQNCNAATLAQWPCLHPRSTFVPSHPLPDVLTAYGRVVSGHVDPRP